MTGTEARGTGRPRLLWVAHQPPLPATEGSHLRTLGLLVPLAGEFDLTVAVLTEGLTGDTAEDRLAGVRWLDLSGSRAGQLASLPRLYGHGLPPVLRHYAQPAQRRVLRDLMSGGGFAAVVADTIYAAAALPPRAAAANIGRVPLVVNTHNVEREVWTHAGTEVSGGRVRLALDRALAPRYELAALDAADGAAFCSQRELDLLAPELRDGLELAVVPNTVDVGRLRPLPAPKRAGQVLFVGNLAYPPNAEAVRFIRDELAPALDGSGLAFVVAGGRSGPEAPADSGSGDVPGVTFAGHPPSLEPLYRESLAVVVPLFHGSGTRLKVLEALALGRPVVATAKAVEGLGLQPERDYLAAEDAAAFAAQLGRLKQEPALRDQLVAAGRLTVEQRFSWDVSGRAFRELLARCGV